LTAQRRLYLMLTTGSGFASDLLAIAVFPLPLKDEFLCAF
jgi:hypothetical protein